MTLPLNDHDRAAAMAAIQKLRGLNSKRRLFIGETVLLVLLLGAAIGGDYVLAFAVFNDFLGPLPGEEGGMVSVGVMALSSIVAMSAYAFYRARNPKALPVRIVEKGAGSVVLVFLIGMGLMVARAISMSAGDMSAGAGELFSEAQISEGLSLLDRFFALAATLFGFAVGALVLAQLYLVEMIVHLVRRYVWEIERLKGLARSVAGWTRTLEETPRQRDALTAERVALQRELEPPAAIAFAHQLVALVHETVAPVVAWIMAQDLIVKASDGALMPPEPLAVDLPALKKRVAALQAIEPKTVMAAFRGEEKVKS